MKCPICHKEVRLEDPFMPFCSERCKLIDLGNWASGKYVIPGETKKPDEDGED
ncbi:MAG: DNA gyrase inhibitor YacG [Acidobacteriia bacterium]|nr:DNA gyrase inhibitor YacG [Terriglobia bacterium]